MSTRRALVASLILLSLLLTAAAPAPSPAEGVRQALTWLRTQQQGDGGFSNGFSAGSDLGTTADAMLAITAGGQDPSTWSPAGASPLDFLANAVQAGNVTNPGAAAKVALAMLAAGKDPHVAAGLDLANPILEGFDAGTGFFGMGPFDSSLAILALTGMHTPLPEGALAGLIAARLPDGAYAFNGDLTPGAGDSNTTALAVQALLSAGRRDDTTASLDYFRAVQNEDDGWTYQKPSAFGEATDANSTALVLQALLASGERPIDWGDPLAALSSLQVPSGAFIFNAATSSENLLATVQALPALAGWDYLDLIDPGHATIPTVTGSVVVEGGTCCVAAQAGSPVSLRSEFQADSPFGSVTQMRVVEKVAGACASEGELSSAEWAPLQLESTFTFAAPLNWIGYAITVQFRDDHGYSSQTYCDEVSVEGGPAAGALSEPTSLPQAAAQPAPVKPGIAWVAGGLLLGLLLVAALAAARRR
jgi:hypothetical protein